MKNINSLIMIFIMMSFLGKGESFQYRVKALGSLSRFSGFSSCTLCPTLPRMKHTQYKKRAIRLSSTSEPWFRNGLSFSCTQCGACCSGSPGSVRFSEQEMVNMASTLGITPQYFKEKYTRVEIHGEEVRWLELKEVPTPVIEQSDGTISQTDGLDCIFLDRKTIPGKAICGVYESRPLQCRTWPFWKENVDDQSSWKVASTGREGCPGIGRGKKYSIDEVLQSVEETEHYRQTLDREAAK